MASLYKRATPLQRKMLRVIEGAVIQAHKAHPKSDIEIERFACGVAKRAVGTLSAQMPDRFAEVDASVTEGGASVVKCPAVVG